MTHLSDVMIFTTGLPMESSVISNILGQTHVLMLPASCDAPDDFIHNIICFGILNAVGYEKV